VDYIRRPAENAAGGSFLFGDQALQGIGNLLLITPQSAAIGICLERLRSV